MKSNEKRLIYLIMLDSDTNSLPSHIVSFRNQDDLATKLFSLVS